ncbi:site-specific DNA-methyltransferase [Candidatus Micrarchaeota archaeon]|jgi:adenine-specific DNA-methyltransferase|nr:site-specific DNA-methyltransferase [Candidatus Micrarchaeota archaeon]
MAAIKDLLRQITDPALKERLSVEIDRLTKNKKFGLVFEEHVPECTPLYGVPIRRNSKVARKVGKMSDIFTVKKVDGESAMCVNKAKRVMETIPITELVSVAQFGEPIFPSLEPIAKVENAPDDSLWHTIIEADNYHALQLLEYLYEGQVDCIYIDPPYNTGARDWKYNNDYVDSNDAYRHSKWLSMMQKRLLIAKRILAKDGVLITTIDDNEYAHLWVLLHDIFPELTHNCVTIQHNPGGTQGKSFSVTNEYAIFSYSAESTIFRKPHTGGDTYNLRRWGSTSGRYEAATCFYPVLLDDKLNIIGFGDVLDDDIHPTAQVENNEDGTVSVWPIDKNGIEKKWRYARATVESVQERMFAEKRGERIEIILHRESEPPKTVWSDGLFNAEAHGTAMIKEIIGGGFPFPKSLYAVREALAFAVLGKKDALIVDFFAGSGTTLNAVNLLNVEDDGHRRCILVTNNEVAEPEVRELKAAGYQPGDPEWESHGICRSVTWPRTEYSILGKRADGTTLTGEYFTTRTTTRAINRSFYQLGFVDNPAALTASTKKQIVASIVGAASSIQKRINRLADDPPKDIKSIVSETILSQSLVKINSRFIISEKHTASVLFDPDASEEWLVALEDQEHITDFYIVAKESRVFNKIKAKVVDTLGTISVKEPLKRPMSEGFPANVEYFKLGFLDKNSVSLGQQFHEILPLLWLKAGAVGERPVLLDEELPPWMILPNNTFAVLLDEDRYGEFSAALHEADGVETIYFVTNSEEAFREMSDGVGIERTYQLYRDYIDNFVIGSRRNKI